MSLAPRHVARPPEERRKEPSCQTRHMPQIPGGGGDDDFGFRAPATTWLYGAHKFVKHRYHMDFNLPPCQKNKKATHPVNKYKVEHKVTGNLTWYIIIDISKRQECVMKCPQGDPFFKSFKASAPAQKNLTLVEARSVKETSTCKTDRKSQQRKQPGVGWPKSKKT